METMYLKALILLVSVLYTNTCSTKMEPDLFCISCCANWIPLGVPTMVMIRSMLPGFRSLMEISQDDWALSVEEEEESSQR